MPAPHRLGPRLVGGYDFAHAIVDDHSRLAYVDLLPDEKGNQALPDWLSQSNKRRPHSSIGGGPPICRVHNLPGPNS
jgi:hypothetical protein